MPKLEVSGAIAKGAAVLAAAGTALALQPLRSHYPFVSVIATAAGLSALQILGTTWRELPSWIRWAAVVWVVLAGIGLLAGKI